MALQRCFWKFARMAARFRGVAARLLRRSQCFKPAPWRRRGIWHDEEAREHRKEGEQWCAASGRCAVRRIFYRIIQRRNLFWLVVVLRWFERFDVKSVVEGKSVTVSVDLDGSRVFKKKTLY